MFIFKDIPFNIFMILLLKIYVDLIVQNLISRNNESKILFSKNKDINDYNNSSYNMGLKILLRGAIISYVFYKR